MIKTWVYSVLCQWSEVRSALHKQKHSQQAEGTNYFFTLQSCTFIILSSFGSQMFTDKKLLTVNDN